MNLKSIVYAFVISSVLPVVSTGCETIISIDDRIGEVLDKSNDWTSEGLPYSQRDLYIDDKNK